jgi:predicted nucleic acid-binding protein
MDRFVVDASVILKWVIGKNQEPDQAQAGSLLQSWGKGRLELLAPTLWQFEVGNFLGREYPQEAVSLMKSLLDLKISEVPITEAVCQRCFDWMKKHKVTFYDAAYLSAAIEVKGRLITADAKFLHKMGRMEAICLISQLDLS